MANIFQYKTIRQIMDNLGSTKQIIIPVAACDKHLLSFAQERLWFIEQYEEGTYAYHIPVLLELNENINQGILKKSLKYLLKRHEVLRTVFIFDNDNDYQSVVDISLLQDIHQTHVHIP